MNAERLALINELMLDMIANTDCSWAVATAAIAFWEHHYQEKTAPVYGLVEYAGDNEHPNVIYDVGNTKRSLKIGVQCAQDEVWFMTLQSV